MAVKTVTDKTFKAKVLESEKPVIVDFWQRGVVLVVS